MLCWKDCEGKLARKVVLTVGEIVWYAMECERCGTRYGGMTRADKERDIAMPYIEAA